MQRVLPVQERWVEAFDGTHIAYHVVGRGRPVLLCNGLGGSWKAWTHQIEYFQEQYRFISWDYRGLYRSGFPEDPMAVRVEDQARDALTIMDAEEIEQAALFGWSMGVQVSLELFRRVPDRVAGLMLLSGVAGRPWETVLNLKAMGRLLPILLRAVRSVSWFAEAVTHRAVRWPETIEWAKRIGLVAPTLDDEVFQEIAESFVELDLELYLRTLQLLGTHDAWHVLRDIDVPVLVVVGDRDLFTPRSAAERMVRRTPGAELMVIPGGTHYVAVEYPELVNLRIQKFLRERGYAPLPEAARGTVS